MRSLRVAEVPPLQKTQPGSSLSDCLDQLRRRLVINRVLVIAAVGLVAALCAYGLQEFVGLASPDFARSKRIVAAAAFGLFCTAAGAFYALRNTVALERIARLADHRFGLAERLSTASELLIRDRRNALEKALLRDADSHVRLVEPRALIPLHVTGAVLAVALAAAFATVGHLYALDRSIPSPDGRFLTAAERTNAATDLERVAARVTEDADEADDPLIRAVAREAERVAQDIRSSTLSERTAVLEELGDLTDQIAAAYERADANYAATDIPAFLNTISAGLGPQNDRDVVQQVLPAGPEQESSPADRAEPSSQDLNDLMGQVAAAQIRPDTSEAGDPREGETATQGPAAPYVEAAEFEMAGAPATPGANDPADPPEAAMLAGAAANAERGGALAGAGDQPLSGEGILEGDPLTAGEEMILADELDEEGGQIRVEAPVTERVAVDAGGNVTAGAWTTVDEAVPERPEISLIDRQTTGRYFTLLSERNE